MDHRYCPQCLTSSNQSKVYISLYDYKNNCLCPRCGTVYPKNDNLEKEVKEDRKETSKLLNFAKDSLDKYCEEPGPLPAEIIPSLPIIGMYLLRSLPQSLYKQETEGPKITALWVGDDMLYMHVATLIASQTRIPIAAGTSGMQRILASAKRNDPDSKVAMLLPYVDWRKDRENINDNPLVKNLGIG